MEEMTEQIFWLDMDNNGGRFRESWLMGLARGQVYMAHWILRRRRFLNRFRRLLAGQRRMQRTSSNWREMASITMLQRRREHMQSGSATKNHQRQAGTHRATCVRTTGWRTKPGRSRRMVPVRA